MSKLIIIRGNSGSGKSTLAKTLQHSFGVEDMKRWWNEKDFLKNIREEIFTREITLEQTADLVYNKVME